MLHGSLCKKAPFLFCPEPTTGHWEASVLPPSFPLLSAALVPGNPAVPQLIKPPIFCCLRGAFSYSRWEGKPALSFCRFQSLPQDLQRGPGGREEVRKESWASDLQREKKSASFTPLQAESLLRKRKRVCQTPAWTVRARTAPGFNLFYPLVTHGGLCRMAATKEKFWGPQRYYPLNRLPLSYVYK